MTDNINGRLRCWVRICYNKVGWKRDYNLTNPRIGDAKWLYFCKSHVNHLAEMWKCKIEDEFVRIEKR